MRSNYKTHASEEKKESVAELTKLITETPILGIVNFHDLPSQQLNVMRKQLRIKDVQLKMAKKSSILRAIEKVKESKKGIEELEEYLNGMPALLFTKENPFSVFKIIKKSKSKAPAKAGQILPSDAVASAGPTGFAPGPIISELASFGIKSKVEDGKITIQEDTVIAKEGAIVDGKLASMLLRLGIEPMEIGLDLVAVYENGTVFTKKVLDIDEEQFLADIENSARWALNLSVEVAYPTKDNVNILIGKVFRDAKGLATEANIMCSETVKDLIGKANLQMLGLKTILGL